MDVETTLREANPGDELRVITLVEDVDETVTVDDVDFIPSPPAPGEDFSEEGELIVHLVDTDELADSLGAGNVMLELSAEKTDEDTWSTPRLAAVDVANSEYTGEEWVVTLVERL